MRSDVRPESRLLTPAEVAALFRVDPKTVTRWAQQGKLKSIRTLGGHRRYSEADIREFLDGPQRVPGPRPASEREAGEAPLRPGTDGGTAVS